MRWDGDKGGRAPGGSSWPEDKELLLRRMWDAKYSASDIARACHDGTTRNAVIGKIHRLRLHRRTPAEIAAALSKNFATVNEQRRVKSEQQRAKSAQAIAERQARAAMTPDERREKQTAIGLAAVAKVELTLVANPAFVKVEKPVDMYAHMRTERGLSDALAALTR